MELKSQSSVDKLKVHFLNQLNRRANEKKSNASSSAGTSKNPPAIVYWNKKVQFFEEFVLGIGEVPGAQVLKNVDIEDY